MRLILVLLLASGFAACKNNSAPVAVQHDSPVSASTAVPADSAARVEQFSFVDGCMENSKLTLGEAKAYTFCKCMYAQIQAKYPHLDSAGISRLDTATIARMAAECR